ncbi:MAG: hypothetical protein R3C30_06645 [Hyphomonadaceae bacterium]
MLHEPRRYTWQRAYLAVSSALLASTVAAQCAFAEPGLADEPESPIVVAGATEFSFRAGQLVGGDNHGDWRARAEASYAYASWWRVGAAAAWQSVDGDTDLTGLAIENVFDVIPTRRWPVHLGAYVEYERNMGEAPDHIELRLLMQRQRGPLDMRLNIISERETGDHSDNRWEFGYAAQASYRLTPALRLGIEGFGDTGFDDQLGDIDDYAHYWGPVAQVRLANVRDRQLSLRFGYLVGSGHADADGQARMQVEWSFGGDDDD